MASTDAKDWPAEAHGVPIPRDRQDHPRLFTTADELERQGVSIYRRMTEEEVANWIESKTGQTKVRPAEIEGEIP